ncbi:MAG: thioesterase family protein [Polyangiaceae bacterium]|nr:thioesterase family protein [Polyangiaceae bacterium]
MDFTCALKLELERPQVYVINVPEGWRHGSGAFGGLVLGYIVRAVLAEQVQVSAHERPLRTITATIAGPLMVGPAKVHVERLRIGKSVTVFAARIVQNDETLAHAVCVLGLARTTQTSDVDHLDIAPPTVSTRWQDIEPLASSLLPEFSQHFEYRFVCGVPFSGSAEAHTTGFIRLREPVDAADAAVVVAHADAWWPSALPRMSTPRLMVTLSFTLEMFGGPELLSSAPLLHTSRAMAGQSGYITEARELWTVDGRLVAANQQTLAIVK